MTRVQKKAPDRSVRIVVSAVCRVKATTMRQKSYEVVRCIFVVASR